MLAAHTLLVDAVTADERLLDRILANDGRFAKFRKVLNDEKVARVLTLQDVAHMLGVTADSLVNFANGRAPVLQGAASELPVSGQNDLGPITTSLDLRPAFERGAEPLGIVLDAISALGPGGGLMVEAPFHPMPLRRVLGGRGFESRAAQISPEHWQVVFRRGNPDPRGEMQ